LTELIAGKTPREALQVSREELVQVLGGLPEASAHASHLAIEALGKLVKQLSP
jgi:NifU-like protein involved in Fe-S cluster formation